ncbi:hemagglutination activity domain protein [Calothrix brevissima NIES-22]|nr:hemagglutination activity domain protein [Calothrix brevissima NIES-22]
MHQWFKSIQYQPSLNCCSKFLLLGLACCTFSSVICKATLVRAEIQLDNTLGGEATVLTPGVEVKGATADIINGGAIRGANLFHSFREFSIGDGQQVYFANPTGVENILTRVTGNNRSEILGTLGVLGNANLFFINPNGIIFGQNARLDVGGSFVASTADSLAFGNGFAFSASNPQAPPLLAINVPLGLQYGSNAFPIELQGARLTVPPGNTLAVIGGDVSLQNGAILQVTDGRIELGGLSSLGIVGLETTNNGFQLQFPEGVERSHVSMVDGAMIEATSDNGGTVAVNAKTFQVEKGSQLFIFTTGDQNATGEMRINATDSIAIAGDDSNIFTIVDSASNGNGASIALQTRSLALTDGGQLGTVTFGRGKAGDIAIAASESITLVGGGISKPNQVTAIASQNLAEGNGGNVAITTGTFTLDQEAQLGALAYGAGQGGNVSVTARDIAIQNGGFLASVVGSDASGIGGNLNIITRSLRVTTNGQLGTNTDGPGAGGTLTIQATQAIVLDGAGAIEGVSTGAFSRSGFGFLSPGQEVGNGGTIEVTTPSLLVTNGAKIDATAFKTGQGGNVAVSVQNLSVLNGAQIAAGTIGSANAGNVKIVATNNATFDGSGAELSGVFTSVEPGASGDGGDIDIAARSLQVTDGAQINASSQGTGIGGNIRIRADSLTLDRQGEISAETASNTGGNITLDVSNLLLLRRGSNLSTTAGTAQAGGNGGNIAIASGLIVASPTEDSNITADAFTGKGGNIDIQTQGIFGIKFRDRQTAFSDITASSQLGINGVVEINTPDVDPSNGLVNLPTNLVDASQQITQSCRDSTGTIANQKSEFIITGRGGLPANPSDILSSDAVWQDLQPHALLNEKLSNFQPQQKTLSQPPTAIVEAQGWEIAANGIVTLVAQAPATTPHNSFVKPVSCPVVQN